jgi:prepilin-type N-terminal cleavage/methylation domain-containing protein
MSRFRNRKGFTLVELMVVVIIVLVLAGIAVPVYMHYIQEGKKSEAYAIIDSMVTGAMVYFQKYSTYNVGTSAEAIAAWLAQDDYDNREYFEYVISDQTANGFVITATCKKDLNGNDWGPTGVGKITWTHAAAAPSAGDPGRGEFDETGW